jgi:hypothetical protein
MGCQKELIDVILDKWKRWIIFLNFKISKILPTILWILKLKQKHKKLQKSTIFVLLYCEK